MFYRFKRARKTGEGPLHPQPKGWVFVTLFTPEVISEIARTTGRSRVTVRKYIHSQVPPTPERRSKRPSKLDDYKEYINQRLQDYPLTAARIYREIQEQGFAGRYTIVKDYVRETRPKVGVPAVYRYETKPGVQAHVNWAKCGYIEIDGSQRKLYCFTMVLGSVPNVM
jgi:transposase